VLKKLEKVLERNDDERRDFWESAPNSKMAFTVPIGIGAHEHTLINQIWKQLGTMSPQQATCIGFILKAYRHSLSSGEEPRVLPAAA
jgi:hypothetical protein